MSLRAAREWVLGKSVEALLSFRSRPSAIRSALEKSPYRRSHEVKGDRLGLAVVQMRLELVEDGVELAEKYHRLIASAVERGAQMVVFPEYAWLPVLGLLPPVRKIALSGIRLEQAVEELAPEGGLTIEGVFKTIAPAVQRIFETTARELAARFHIYLMPGSIIRRISAGQLFNTAYLFGPDGNLIGTQDKLHPTKMEKDWMTCGRDLRVWKLPFGGVAMPVCMDFTYWESTRMAVSSGADLLIDMSADATADQPYLAMRGDETRIQESYAYSTRAYAVTDLFGLGFTGPSHIAAPLGLRGDTTYLAMAGTRDGEEVITADLDWEELREFRSKHPYDWNSRLYAKYLPGCYQDYRARVTQDGNRRKV